MDSLPPGRLVLVRHGETAWAQQGRHTGLTDVVLTPDGEAQARRLAGPLDGFSFGLTLCSPLQRSRRTAELAGRRPAVDPDLVEWDYGGYEGLTTEQVREWRGDGWTVFGDGVVPGTTPGESLAQVATRADRVLARVVPALEGGDALLVGHGHALRILAARYLGRDPDLAAQLVLGPGTMSVLGYEHTRAVLSWNVAP
jgi:probable phosphoglycerate mutase